jgi:hypothetical protein
LGHAEEARQWLGKGIKGMEQEAGDSGLPWNRRLTLQLLCREAEALLRQPAAEQREPEKKGQSHSKASRR